MTTPPAHVRLLPWPGPEGKPAHLVTDGTRTFFSRLADTVESRQVDAAAVILSLAKPMVEDGADLTAPELRWIARRLVESLTDVLNIAESRGRRIPPYEAEAEGEQSPRS
ncbi:hypothetical protein [Streptomyces sp. C10-9-1]|uniref:hypothetical protein n=1 Tax=Streptomyces sp. C10-9-1 TaxID=1859285 RepID=UPI003F4A55EB